MTKRVHTSNSRAVRARRAAGDDRGSSLVEFALVLPLLLLLLLGMVDFGKAINYWIDQQHLANEAARWAAVNKSPTAGVGLESAIKSQANTLELRDGGSNGSVAAPGVSVCISFPDDGRAETSPGETGTPLRVKVRATYRWLTYIAGEIGVAATTIRGTATMRVEVPYKGDGTDAYTPQGSCP